MKIARQSVFLLITAIVLALNAQAAAIDAVYNSGGIAIKGYDPVAYFKQGRPMIGDPAFDYQWMGSTWQFANQANLDSFSNIPETYAPQYGGYCTYAVSTGSVTPIDPLAWTIFEDKLYLNYSRSIKKRWLKNKSSYIASANENWPGLKAK